MRAGKLIGALLAVLSLAAGPASAGAVTTASNLTLRTAGRGVLPAGTTVSGAITVVNGNVDCGVNLGGKLLSNGKPTDKLSLTEGVEGYFCNESGYSSTGGAWKVALTSTGKITLTAVTPMKITVPAGCTYAFRNAHLTFTLPGEPRSKNGTATGALQGSTAGCAKRVTWGVWFIMGAGGEFVQAEAS